MACHWHKLPDGTTVHINMATPRKRRCAFCDCRDAKALCDYRLPSGKTCDKAICFRHRVHVGADRDYCLDHDLTKPMPAAPAAMPVQGGLFE
jgi:hypothetical protein